MVLKGFPNGVLLVLRYFYVMFYVFGIFDFGSRLTARAGETVLFVLDSHYILELYLHKISMSS